MFQCSEKLETNLSNDRAVRSKLGHIRTMEYYILTRNNAMGNYTFTHSLLHSVTFAEWPLFASHCARGTNHSSRALRGISGKGGARVGWEVWWQR